MTPKTTVQGPIEHRTRNPNYNAKLDALEKGEEVNFSPTEFILYLLDKQHIGFLRFNRKLGNGDTYFETDILNTLAGNGRSHPLPKPLAEKMAALTGVPTSYWTGSTQIPSAMSDIISIDMNKNIDGLVKKYSHLSLKNTKGSGVVPNP